LGNYASSFGGVTVNSALSIFDKFSDIPEFAAISKDVFQTVNVIDPQFYGNPNGVAWTRDNLWSNLQLPVDANAVANTQIRRQSTL
jgi:hypothetical protein